MSWLSQNWFWVALAIGVAWWLFRSGFAAHGGHAGGHGGGLGGLLGGLGGHGGHGSGGHGSHGGQDEQPEGPGAPDAPEAAVDPVGGEPVRTAHALTSVYQGKIYYFASKENRERFETAPQEYAHKSAGHPLRSNEAVSERPRRRRGC